MLSFICYIITWWTCFFPFFFSGWDRPLPVENCKVWWHWHWNDICSLSILIIQCLEGTLTPVRRGRKPLTGRDKQQSDHYSTCSCWYWGDSWKEMTRSQLAESHKELQWRNTTSCVTTQRASDTSYTRNTFILTNEIIICLVWFWNPNHDYDRVKQLHPPVYCKN